MFTSKPHGLGNQDLIFQALVELHGKCCYPDLLKNHSVWNMSYILSMAKHWLLVLQPTHVALAQ